MCSGGPGGIRLTRCGVVCGLAALAALSTALLGPTWLHTEEKLAQPNLPRNFANVVSVRFKLGLFRVCPTIVKPANFTFREYNNYPPYTITTAKSVGLFRMKCHFFARSGRDTREDEQIQTTLTLGNSKMYYTNKYDYAYFVRVAYSRLFHRFSTERKNISYETLFHMRHYLLSARNRNLTFVHDIYTFFYNLIIFSRTLTLVFGSDRPF